MALTLLEHPAVVTDSAGRIRAVNPALRQVLGGSERWWRQRPLSVRLSAVHAAPPSPVGSPPFPDGVVLLQSRRPVLLHVRTHRLPETDAHDPAAWLAVFATTGQRDLRDQALIQWLMRLARPEFAGGTCPEPAEGGSMAVRKPAA